MGDLIAIAFLLVILGSFFGRPRFGSGIISNILSYFIGGVITFVVAVAILAVAAALHLAIIAVVVIVALVILCIWALLSRRRRFYDCSVCQHLHECHANCHGRHYVPFQNNDRRG